MCVYREQDSPGKVGSLPFSQSAAGDEGQGESTSIPMKVTTSEHHRHPTTGEYVFMCVCVHVCMCVCEKLSIFPVKGAIT